MAIRLRPVLARGFAEAGARTVRPRAALRHAAGAAKPDVSDRRSSAVGRAPACGSGGSRVAQAWLCQKLLIAIQGAGDVVVKIEAAVGQNRAAVAILTDGPAVMRHQDDVGALHAVAKCRCAFVAEP